jgi:salicylate hydroxylase
VLRALGLEKAVKACGFEPDAVVGRDWTTGKQLFRVPLKGMAGVRYGAATVDVHRADLLGILADTALESHLHLTSRCVAVSSSDREAVITLDCGRRETFDLVVGCDGIRSAVRTALHGFEPPRFTGNMCWRTLIATEKLPEKHVPSEVAIWTGPGGHIVTFYVRGGALVNVVAVQETSNWIEESWSVEARTSDLVAAFPGVHGHLRKLLRQAEQCFKWGLFDREPLGRWSAGCATLLGDAAHPMLPFLGQGAAMAMEDGYILARELARSPDDVPQALRAYEAERVPRTARVQLAVREQAKFFHLTSAGLQQEGFTATGTEQSEVDRSVASKSEWLYDYDPTCQPR